MNKKYAPLTLSIVLHVAIIGVLVMGDFTSTPKPTPVAAQVNPIQAVVVDQSSVNQQVEKLKKQKADAAAAEKKRQRDAEKRLADAKKKRIKEEARIKDLERQRQNKIKEKKRADDAAKKAKEKAVAAEKAHKKKLAEQKKADEAAAAAKAKKLKAEKAAAEKKAREQKIKAEQERKRKEQEAKERALQDQMLQEQLAEEMAGRQQARQQQVMTELNRYTALIIQTIQRNLITDKSTMDGKSCKLTISLATSGFVTNVSSGQGDRIVCDAAQKAVYKAGTLPVSKDPDVFQKMRQISVTVIPEF